MALDETGRRQAVLASRLHNILALYSAISGQWPIRDGVTGDTVGSDPFEAIATFAAIQRDAGERSDDVLLGVRHITPCDDVLTWALDMEGTIVNTRDSLILEAETAVRSIRELAEKLSSDVVELEAFLEKHGKPTIAMVAQVGIAIS